MSDPRLTAYALGELAGAELKQVEEIIRASPEALREVEKIRRMAGRLRSELNGQPTPGSNAGLWRGLIAMIMGALLLAAVSRYVFFPPEVARKELPPIGVTVQLDPPVETNPELRLPADKVWMTVAVRKSETVPPGADVNAIHQVMTEGIPRLRDCFPAGKAAPAPVFSWSIDAKGRMIQLKSDKSGGEKLEICLAQRMSAWQFPMGAAGPFTYEIRLSPKTSKPKPILQIQ